MSRLFPVKRHRPMLWLALLLSLAALCAPAVAQVSTAVQERALVIRNTRVFDGLRVRPRVTVVVEHGKIVTVGRRAKIPAGAEVIDGEGLTLLPGLIDAHTHDLRRPLLQQGLMFGVTTHLEMFTPFPRFAAGMRREQAEGRAADRADLFSAGICATAPGGHGTQFGVAIPTINDPGQAQAFVDARVAEGSDYIKIVLEEGSVRYPLGRDKTLDEQTLRALVVATHRRGKLALAHVSEERYARMAIEAGVDGLVHVHKQGRADASFARLASSRGVFVIPTLANWQSNLGSPAGEALAADPRLAPYVPQDQLANLRNTRVVTKFAPDESYAVARATVLLLKNKGVPILAGTDSLNRALTQGVSLHRELELLVEAGLTPVEALRAATSAPAKAFRLSDRGRIRPGARADLLLVRGDPTRDILRTRDIVAVWKRGVAADREGYRTELQKEKNQTPE